MRNISKRLCRSPCVIGHQARAKRFGLWKHRNKLKLVLNLIVVMPTRA
jgi:hypothetical protein